MCSIEIKSNGGFLCGVSVYEVLTGQIVQKLKGHAACVRDVSWHPYENNLVSSSVSIFSIA